MGIRVAVSRLADTLSALLGPCFTDPASSDDLPRRVAVEDKRDRVPSELKRVDAGGEQRVLAMYVAHSQPPALNEGSCKAVVETPQAYVFLELMRATR